MAENDALDLEDALQDCCVEVQDAVAELKGQIIRNYSLKSNERLGYREAAEILSVLIKYGILKTLHADKRLKENKHRWLKQNMLTPKKIILTTTMTTLKIYGKIPDGSTPPVTFKGVSYRFVDESVLRQRLIGKEPKA